MWKRGGRSTALERAEALLLTRKRPTNTDSVVKGTSVPPKALTSDLNDPSVTSDSEGAVGVLGSTGTEKSMEGGRSRFLKKAPTSATLSKSPVQHRPEPRYRPESRFRPEPGYLASSHHSSQSSALSPLAQTENRSSRSKRSRHDLGVSAAGAQSAEAATVLSARFSPDHSLDKRPFLKNTTARSAVTAGPKRNQSGAMPPSDDASVPVVGVTPSARGVSGVSVDSDEEDMKRLLEESEGSTHHTRRPGTAASTRATDKTSNRQSHKVIGSSVASARRPSPSDPSPPRHRSPLGWTGAALNPPSPAVLSPSPRRSSAPPSPPDSPVSTYRKARPSRPQRSPSSTSSLRGALSVEELFPVDRHSNDSGSEMSSASSEDFKINVMGLDDLVPGFTEETGEKKLCGSPDVGPSDGLKEEEVLDYHSDFDPVTWTESSTSQISEHILGEGEEEEPGSEVREDTAGSRLSCQKTEDHGTSSVSDTSPNCSLTTSDRSQDTKASGGVRRRGFTEPHDSKTSVPGPRGLHWVPSVGLTRTSHRTFTSSVTECQWR
ncbi:uncharacterized protein C19orf44 homolog [Sphaeramia orbicularis]|uniref:uncharacterized protein C19orf44 homolog n=1 Tax=Sphaeramia orbicularis TaxID=375764 RepID=UPI0011806BA0|nr:serine/arginine repetitive matrix protein 1-like [Sphaeramia orbicularis]